MRMTVIIILCLLSLIPFISHAELPPPTGVSAFVVPDYDRYGNAQKKLTISWSPYYSAFTCCDVTINALVEYQIAFGVKRGCATDVTSFYYSVGRNTSFSLQLWADISLVSVEVYARVLTGCFHCGAAGNTTTAPSYYTLNLNDGECNSYVTVPPEEQDKCSARRLSVGEPVNITNGEMSYENVDFTVNGINIDLQFKRSYSNRLQLPSASSGITSQVSKSNGSILFSELMGIGHAGISSSEPSQTLILERDGLPSGYGWTHNFNAHLDFLQSGMVVRFFTEDGKSLYFNKNEDSYVASRENSGYELEDNGDGTFTLGYPEGRKLIFNDSGRLLSVVHPAGNHIELSYNSGGQLKTIYDTLGNEFTINYDSSGRMTSVYGPATSKNPTGVLVTYQYASYGRLQKAIYPDGSSITYEYNDPNDNLNITRITGRDGRIHRYVYDAKDRVSSFSEDDGVSYSMLTYNPDSWYTTLKNTRGYNTNFYYEVKNRTGILKNSTGGSTCSTCTSPNYSYESDNLGRITSVTDVYGNVTYYEEFGNTGNPGKVRYGGGTVDETVITYTYHPDMNIPVSVKAESVFETGDRAVIIDYDEDGNDTANENPGALPRRFIQKGYTKDNSREEVPYEYISLFSYDENARLLSVDGPRNDVNDIVSFEYYPSDSSYGLNKGRLKSVTDASGNVYVYGDYDIYGNAGGITYPDGTVAELDYDVDGNLIEVSGGDSVWTYEYYPGGKLHYEIMPEGNIIEYVYDDVGNISMIKRRIGPEKTSAVSETSIYEYDKERNLIAYELREGDEEGEIIISEEFAYNAENMLTTYYPDSFDESVSYGIAKNIVLIGVREPSIPAGSGPSWRYYYDSLLRLKSVVEFPNSHNLMTQYAYDNLGNIKSITDSKGNSADFEYDDLGRLLYVWSDERGENIYSYGEHSEPEYVNDRGKGKTYSYDASRGIGKIKYGSGNEVNFNYDELESSYGSGKLTSVNDDETAVRYHYDAFGSITREVTLMNGREYTTEYGYDKNGRITSIVSPSGMEINYVYSDNGTYPDSVLINKADGTTTEIEIVRGAMGNEKQINYPSGVIENISYDSQYRISAVKALTASENSLLDFEISRDGNGNILEISDNLNTADSYSYLYDSFNRILSSSGPYGEMTFTYDEVGNRLSSTLNDEEKIFSYEGNRITGISGDVSKSYLYNSAGMLQSDGEVNFSYDENNRMESVIKYGGKAVSYGYNFKGERDRKEKNGNWLDYFYDLEGRLICILDRNGNPVSDFVYAGERRIALMMPLTDTQPKSYRVSVNKKNKQPKRRIIGKYLVKVKVGKGKAKFKVKDLAKKKKRNKKKAHKSSVESDITIEGAPEWDNIRKILSADVILRNNSISKVLYNVDVRVEYINKTSVTTVNQDGYTSEGKSFWYYGKIAENGENTVYWEFYDPPAESFTFTVTVMGSYAPDGQKVYYYHNDHLGRPVMMTDEDGGVAWKGKYYPFGKVYQSEGVIKNNFRFPGQWEDEETGLFYNGARYYDPSTGRYISTDPVIGDIYFPQTLNPYVYVVNNPQTLTDPKGLFFSNWHGWLTYKAMRDANYDVIDSICVAWYSIMADRPSTQGYDAASANRHAMSGVLPNSLYQSRKEAQEGTNGFINDKLSVGDFKSLGEALHAGEDAHAKGHNFKPWDGLGFNKSTYHHLKDDFLPSEEDKWKAYVDDLININKFKQKKKFSQ